MTEQTLPKPHIKRRPIEKAIEAKATENGCDPLLAQLLASRVTADLPLDTFLDPKLSCLDNPSTLADCDKAARRLVQAILSDEVIGIETDHDCDGQTSHAVIFTALTEYFGVSPDRIRSYIGHRLKEGYGLSDPVVDRILAESTRPSLIITADNGSGDEARIQRLKAEHIDVIVTDHHGIPESGIPQSAFAVVNPLREDSQYPDKSIAGCMVAWLVMAMTRIRLTELTEKAIPSLGGLLDYVAVGTVADCVSMANSLNNRVVVYYGLKLLAKRLRPCWRAVLLPGQPVTSEDLGFKIGPLLNSDGRLACAFGSVSFLLAKTDEEANDWVAHLREQNTQRKSIQDKITQKAIEQALEQTARGKLSLCLFLEDGHAGVHGISASRIKDLFGRPTVIFCPREENKDLLTGSARSIEGLHLKNLFEKIQENTPGCLEKFGGHEGAAGLTIRRENLPIFEKAFEKTAGEWLAPERFGPIVWTDGPLPEDAWACEYLENLEAQLAPFGRGFEPPQFEAVGKIISLKPVGQTKIHAKLEMCVGELWFEGIWFNAIRENNPWPVKEKDEVRFVAIPKVEYFRGRKSLKGQIVYLEAIK